jgi:DNA-binding transcriptional ArsR family regulator
MTRRATARRTGGLGRADLVGISARFRILSVATRLAILHALHDGEMTVSALSTAVGSSQPNVSKHLRVLVGAGMVARREQGATTWCRIADPLVFRLCDLVCASPWGKARR